MRKELIAIIVLFALLVVGWVVYTKTSITSGITNGVQKLENEGIKHQVTIVEKSKTEGEKVTTVAEETKSAIRKEAAVTKERLRESFSSVDDIPLPDIMVDELCRAYSYSDCIPAPTNKPLAGNKG